MRYYRSRTRQQNAAAGRTGSDEQGSEAAPIELEDKLTEAYTRPRKVDPKAVSTHPDTNLAQEEISADIHGGGYGLAEPMQVSSVPSQQQRPSTAAASSQEPQQAEALFISHLPFLPVLRAGGRWRVEQRAEEREPRRRAREECEGEEREGV